MPLDTADTLIRELRSARGVGKSIRWTQLALAQLDEVVGSNRGSVAERFRVGKPEGSSNVTVQDVGSSMPQRYGLSCVCWPLVKLESPMISLSRQCGCLEVGRAKSSKC